MRPTHHPDCALSLDGLDGEECIAGYKTPRCTCRQIRRTAQQRKALKQRKGQTVHVSDGSYSLGDGNYYRPPLRSGY